MLIAPFGAITKGQGENTKGVGTDMYWVPLIVGVTRLLKLGIVWIIGYLISCLLLTIGRGSDGGPKFSTKYHNPLVVEGILDVHTVEDMVGTSAIEIKTGPIGSVREGV